ncbi:MAG TPA: IS66 family transposase [Candidatus Tetragenococcus pullicola]|nr:IS66 family transposase [Candidatus Tetragenococcus pullicola]
MTKTYTETEFQALQKQNEKLTVALEQSTAQITHLNNQVILLNKMLFGSKSEKTKKKIEEIPSNQLSLFEEVSDTIETDEKQSNEKTKTIVSTYTRRRRTPEWKKKQLENLPTEEIDHIIDEPICDCCGHSMHELGVKDWEEVMFIPAKLVRYLHHVHSYECTECKKSGTNHIQKAPSPKRALPGSIASPSMIAEATYNKFEQFVPLERQLKDWSRLGLTLHSRTLVGWVNKVAEEYLEPVYVALKGHLLENKKIQADETPYRIINRSDEKPGRAKAQNWVYRTTPYVKHPVVLFDSTLSRGRKELKGFLGKWTGLILCDGYTVYDQIEGIEFAHCWVHVRRYWNDAVELGGDYPTPQAILGLDVCNALFRMERDWKDLPEDERTSLRHCFSKPIIEDFFRWMQDLKVAANSGIARAVNYSLNRKEGLVKFIDHPDLPIHNNASENAIRPLTLGRKNWLHSTSEAGGKANAIYLSLVETCKANDIDFRKYIEKLLIELPEVDLLLNPERVDDYLPWSDKIVTSCQPAKTLKKKTA